MSQRSCRETLMINGAFLGVFGLSLLGIWGWVAYNNSMPQATGDIDTPGITEPDPNWELPPDSNNPEQGSSPSGEVQYSLSGPTRLEDGTEVYILNPFGTQIYVSPGQDIQELARITIQAIESSGYGAGFPSSDESPIAPNLDRPQIPETNQSAPSLPSNPDQAGDECYYVIPPGNEGPYYTDDHNIIAGINRDNETNDFWAVDSRVVQMPDELCE